MDAHRAALRRRVAKAPQEPGVYRWLNAEGEVLYVGKAKNLRARLRSYVGKPDKSMGPWKLSMLDQLHDVDVTVTNSELEALVLETNLIKELRPKYNVLMKDDKHYVYVEVTHRAAYPSVRIVRSMTDDRARYFGPFLSRYDTQKTLDMLHEIFCFRACSASIARLNKAGDAEPSTHAPCLDYQIGRCCGLCAGAVTAEEYRHRIDQVMAFFRGDFKPVIEDATKRMHQAAAERRFERAARLRDLLHSVESLREKQIVSDTSGEDVDVFGVAVLSQRVQVVMLRKRNGKLIGEDHFTLAGRAEQVADVLPQLLLQYYDAAPELPPRIVVGEDFEDRSAAAAYLTQKRGAAVHIVVPERGRTSRLLELAERNAHEKAKQQEATWEADRRNTDAALEELLDLLQLPDVPTRIEGYDISHTGGTDTVGSMVVFLQGKPRNDHYRSFTIHSMQRGAVDDYRALQEVLGRRLRHIAGGLHAEEEHWRSAGITCSKARKAEEPQILAIIQQYPKDLSATDVSYAQYLVAREQEELVAFVRLRTHPGKLLEMGSLWVDERYRGQKLGQFLVRKLLRSVKKGKVYARVYPELEAYHASVGFRHVHRAPALFQEALRAAKEKDPAMRERVVLVYDAVQNKSDVSLSAVPDLLVIDGGKGQLNAVRAVMKQRGVDIPVIGLAKREEEVFVPGQSLPLVIPKDSPARFLLMRIRDEAHRSANRHRSTRARKHAMQSSLDLIPGLGAATRRSLLRRFKSADGVGRASDTELQEILSPEQIRAVREFL